MTDPTRDEVAKLLENVTPGDWKAVRMTIGYKLAPESHELQACFVEPMRLQVYGPDWKHTKEMSGPDSDYICANAALIALAPFLARQYIASLKADFTLTETGGARMLADGGLGCLDCGEPYGSPRFPDLVIDNDAFAKIAPNPPDGGLLCPNCICARLEKAGVETTGRFTSGPLRLKEMEGQYGSGALGAEAMKRAAVDVAKYFRDDEVPDSFFEPTPARFRIAAVINALPSPSPADILAAALALPKIAALVEAAEAVSASRLTFNAASVSPNKMAAMGGALAALIAAAREVRG